MTCILSISSTLYITIAKTNHQLLHSFLVHCEPDHYDGLRLYGHWIVLMSLCRLYSVREVSIRTFRNEWTPNIHHARRANPPRPLQVTTKRHVTTEESRPSVPVISKGLGSEVKGLPSEDEHNRSSFLKGLTSRMDNIQAVVFNAGQRLNELTGYSGIEALKIAIEEQGGLQHSSLVCSIAIYNITEEKALVDLTLGCKALN